MKTDRLDVIDCPHFHFEVIISAEVAVAREIVYDDRDYRVQIGNLADSVTRRPQPAFARGTQVMFGTLQVRFPHVIKRMSSTNLCHYARSCKAFGGWAHGKRANTAQRPIEKMKWELAQE